MTRSRRGFTLMEMMVVVAIVGIVAAIAIPTLRSARRNAVVASSGFELAMWLDGLRARAMRDQEDLVAVVLDVPGNDADFCAHGMDDRCGRYALLRPAAGFTLKAIGAGSYPNAENLADEQLGRGVRFHRTWDGKAAPRPFSGVKTFDPELVANCGGRACIGVRFRGDGEVQPEYPDGQTGGTKTGVAFAIGSDLSTAGALGTDQRLVVVSVPMGIVKSYPISQAAPP